MAEKLIQPAYASYVGASLPMRAAAQLIAAASRLLSRGMISTYFADSEEAATSWLVKQRTALRGSRQSRTEQPS